MNSHQVRSPQVYEVVVFDKVEIHWLKQALKGKLANEELILEFLEATFEACDDFKVHLEQVLVQKRIVESHQALLKKLDACGVV